MEQFKVGKRYVFRKELWRKKNEFFISLFGEKWGWVDEINGFEFIATETDISYIHLDHVSYSVLPSWCEPVKIEYEKTNNIIQFPKIRNK